MNKSDDMPRRRPYLAIAGLLLLLASIALFAVASSTQTREIDYGTAGYFDTVTLYYIGPTASLPPAVKIGAVLAIGLVVALIGALSAVIEPPLRKRIEWLRKGAREHLPEALLREDTRQKARALRRWIGFAVIVLAFTGWIAFYLLVGRPLQTAHYGQSPAPGQPSGYIAFAELSGPTQIRFGDSTEIAFTVWITEGLVLEPISNLVLAPDQIYTATAHLQAVNFDLDESSRTAQVDQPLSVARSAFWSWVVSPKEKRLGRQTLVVRANVLDAQGNRVGDDPYLSAVVSVTDPIGIPGPVYYVLIGFGGVVSLPLWPWLYKRWDAKRKEQQDEKLKELEEEVRDLKARKWWQFWK